MKKIIILILLIASLSLSACNQGDSNDSPPEDDGFMINVKVDTL